jgi:hypothetical protein
MSPDMEFLASAAGLAMLAVVAALKASHRVLPCLGRGSYRSLNVLASKDHASFIGLSGFVLNVP